MTQVLVRPGGLASEPSVEAASGQSSSGVVLGEGLLLTMAHLLSRKSWHLHDIDVRDNFLQKVKRSEKDRLLAFLKFSLESGYEAQIPASLSLVALSMISPTRRHVNFRRNGLIEINDPTPDPSLVEDVRKVVLEAWRDLAGG